MNYRQTHQKQSILEIIQGKGRHMSAEEVLKAVQAKEPGIGLATVYRNLNLLCQTGKIQKIQDGETAYFDGNPQPHDHLHCIRCGRFFDVSSTYDPQLDRQTEAQTGASILSHSTTYEGVCKECREKEEEESKSWN